MMVQTACSVKVLLDQHQPQIQITLVSAKQDYLGIIPSLFAIVMVWLLEVYATLAILQSDHQVQIALIQPNALALVSLPGTPSKRYVYVELTSSSPMKETVLLALPLWMLTSLVFMIDTIANVLILTSGTTSKTNV